MLSALTPAISRHCTQVALGPTGTTAAVGLLAGKAKCGEVPAESYLQECSLSSPHHSQAETAPQMMISNQRPSC